MRASGTGKLIRELRKLGTAREWLIEGLCFFGMFTLLYVAAILMEGLP